MEEILGLAKRRALPLILAIFFFALAVFVVFRPGDQASAGVDLGDPHAWIEHGIDGELLQINSVTGEVTARIAVAEPGQRFHAVPHADGAAVVNTDASSVSLVSGRLLSVTSSVPIEPITGASEDADAPSESGVRVFGSTDSAGDVVVLSNARVLSVDPQNSLVTPTFLPAPLPSAVQDESGRVVALSSDAESVVHLESDGLVEVADLAAPVGDTGDQRSLVRAGAGTFVVDPSRLSIAEILPDGTTGLPFCTTSAANGAITGGSAKDDEPTILAYNPTTSTLNVSSPNVGCRNVDVGVDGDNFGAPVATNGMAYLPNWSSGRIVVVDLEGGSVVANYPFGTRGVPFELEVFGSTVWANEPLGPFAAVIDGETITPISKISTIVAGAATAGEGGGEGESLASGDGDTSGLRIIGESGESVIASGGNGAQSGSGIGTGPEGGDDFGGDNPGELLEPSAVGIEIDSPTVSPDPVGEPEQAPEVTETLIANFSASTGIAIEGEVLRFTDSSTGSPTSWTWDFGDGTGAQEPSVEKAWEREGIYLVSLTVTNASGDESTQLAEVTVVPKSVPIAPTADFSFDRSTIEVGESVMLIDRSAGEVDLLEWDFGDGDSGVGATVTHTYDKAGVYTVTLTASNGAGVSSTSTEVTVVSAVEAPRAAIAAISTSIVEGQFVTLKSASLNEPTRLSWDFGDGTKASGEFVSHAWGIPGTYRVRLTAENSEGSDSTFVDVVVSERVDQPVSQFTQSATEVMIGDVVTFTNLSLNEPTKLIWNFGDDTSARGETAKKSWSKPGRYRVTLRATNDAGTNRTGVTITVVKPVEAPVASFTSSSSAVAPNTEVNFTDATTGTVSSWTWNFGDGNLSAEQNPSHRWATPGTYNVTLTARNEGGSTVATRQIVVKEVPSANFRWEAVEGTTIKFTDTSWNDPRSWRWDFGDGTTSTDRSPTHTFASGTFTVSLVVSNEAGTSDATTQQVVAIEPPVARPVCVADGPRLRCTAEQSERFTGVTWEAEEAVTNSNPNGVETVFTFASSGRYDVRLRVANAAGATDEEVIRAPRVTRGRKPRVATVDVAAVEGRLVRLRADFDRDPTSWNWTVEGAELVEGGDTPEPLFRVATSGDFEGVVKATNEWGTDTDPFEFRAVLQEPRVTDVVVAAVEGDLVRLKATFDRNPTSWEWSVDGAELVEGGTTSEPVFRIGQNGTFDGQATASNAFGSDTTAFSFSASPFTTTASFTWTVIEPGVVQFQNTSEARNDAVVEWRFGGNPEVLNGDPGGPGVRYSNNGGTFRVVIVVEDVNGRSVYREDIVVPAVVVPEVPEGPGQ